MFSEYQDWRWKVYLGNEHVDSVDLFLSLSGRDEVKVNGYIMNNAFSFRLYREYKLKMSDDSMVTVAVGVDWSKWMPKVTLVSDRGHRIEQVIGPAIQESSLAQSKDMIALKYIALGLIWTLPLATRGGLIAGGFAGVASFGILHILKNTNFSKSKKVMLILLTVVGAWVGAFSSIYLLLAMLKNQ
jgi:hypothetical protein